MASFGKVLDLLDDRYLELQDVIGNVEPLPQLVPYEEYDQNVLVYRIDTNHEIFMGVIQDFTMRRATETRKELWTWLVQWEVDNTPPKQQLSSPKKVRLEAPQPITLSKSPLTPRQAPALTIFERRTLDGTLMLEEDLLRILIDIVQVGSSLVPNFVEFLYRWIDYYEGDGKALKAALAWEIPSLWDFEYHPLVIPREEEIKPDKIDGDNTDGQWDGGAGSSNTTELRQSSPTKKMNARPKPDLAAIELSTLHSEVSERLKYREVKFGIQPPKLEQPLPPLINIPRDNYKRIKYYAACFKSRQRALYLLLEAGLTTRQVNNYQKLQTVHPKETSETGDGSGLRNYHKDAKFAQAHFELREKQTKQREIAISNKLAVEAELAASHAVPDGANGLPLIPPTPSHTRRTGMETILLRRLKEMSAKNKHKINVVPKPLVGRLKSKVFENASEAPVGIMCGSDMTRYPFISDLLSTDDLRDEDEGSGGDFSNSSDSESDDEHATAVPAFSFPTLPPQGRPLLPRPPMMTTDAVNTLGDSNRLTGQPVPITNPTSAVDQSIQPNMAAYIQNLTGEQAQRLVPLIQLQREHLRAQSAMSQSPALSTVGHAVPSSSVQSGYTTVPNLPQASQAQLSHAFVNSTSGIDNSMGSYQTAGTRSSFPSAGPSMLSPDRLYQPYWSASGAQDGQNQSFSDSRPQPAPEGSRSIPDFPPPSNIMATPFANIPPGIPPPPGFEADYFRNLRRQQQAAQSATTSNDLAQSAQPILLPSRPQPMTVSGLSQQGQQLLPGQETLSANPAATNAQTRPAETEDDQSTRQSSLQRNTAQAAALIPGHWTPRDPAIATLRPILTLSPASPQQQLPAQLPVLHPLPDTQATNQALSGHAPTPTLYPPPSSAMLPPICPGITRNAPSPLSIAPQSPSVFTTFNSEVLATSPFLSPSPNSRKPIQIYFPKILVPGNGIGPGGSEMGNKGCIETDALILGYEDAKTGALVLSKAILLPMGVWENMLRRARNRHCTVLETYPHPSMHPDKPKGKGKEKADQSASEEGCHRAVYDKLAQAYGMINAAPKGREEELTKRWRVNKGPMTSSDRGAVWEGWGVYVDRGIEMSASERQDALKFKEGFWPYSSAEEAERRRKEIDEMIEEDDAMDGDDEM